MWNKPYQMKNLLVIGILVFASIPAFNQDAIFSARSVHHPVIAENGMVASQHPLATQVGVEILKQGGNAVDAAVAVGFALAVVLPRAGNIGGGGFMIVHDAKKKETKAINYREKAPLKATPNMFLDENGEVDKVRSKYHHQTVGVPGTVAGFALALEKYGTMPISKVMQPAITLAKEGFPITWDLARVLEVYQKTMKDWPSSMEIFYKPGGSLYRAGELLVQSDLAWSLEQIAKDGAAAFYEGAIADKIVTDMRANGGLITKKDLKKYTAIEVEPVWGTYKNYKVASMPPPSSGGIHLIQMLNILEAYDLKGIGSNTAQTIHLMTEAMKRAYADRSKHLGDPDFYDVPTNELVAKGYAEFLREGINEEKATPSSEIAPGNPVNYESEETTHFSVVDKDGNVVSNTYTLNFSFGTGIVADGTGILLNNEMADFLHKLGEPNAFGLMEGEANKVEPEKRMLSAMTPTIVFENDTPYLVTGSPGGSRIITSVLQVILNTLEHEMNVAEATHTPRIHHQWQPDVLYIEENLNKDTRVLLEAKGYKLEERTAMGSTQSILVKDGMLYGSSDPRRPDAFTKGY